MPKVQKEEAIHLLREAIKVEPGNIFAHTLLAYYLAIDNKQGEAEKEYRLALELSKGEHAKAWLGLARLLEKLNRKQEALEAYTNYLKNRKKSSPEDSLIKRNMEAIKKELEGQQQK